MAILWAGRRARVRPRAPRGLFAGADWPCCAGLLGASSLADDFCRAKAAAVSSVVNGPVGGRCCALLLGSARLMRLPLLRRSRRLQRVSDHVAAHRTDRGRRSAILAGLYLFACWTTRAVGSALLLNALGFAF